MAVNDVMSRPRFVSRFLPSLVVLVCCVPGNLRAPAPEAEPKKASPTEPPNVLKDLPPQATNRTLVTSYYLANVPEIEFQAAPGERVNAKESRERIARMIADISELDKKEADGFIKALGAERADFAGLPFL